MTARTHDLGAITALGVVAIASGPQQSLTLSTVLIAILANQLGGIVPDIDQPTAPLWRNLPIGRFLGKVFDRLMGGHRFISHSLIGVVLFSAGVYILLHFLKPIMPHVNETIVLSAFIIGMLSHLLMDTFTKEGVPWLLPLPIKFGLPPLKAWRISTGKSIETLIVFPLLVALDIWLCVVHYNQLTVFLHQVVH